MSRFHQKGSIVFCVKSTLPLNGPIFLFLSRLAQKKSRNGANDLGNKSNRVRTTDAFSGELPAFLSLNRLLNGILSYSWCYFVRIRPISQKFNSCVTDGRTDRRTDRRTDGPTDGRTDGRTDTPSYRDARTHLKIFCDTSSPIAQRQVRPFDFSEVAVMSAHIYYMVSVGTCAVPIELKCTNDWRQYLSHPFLAKLVQYLIMTLLIFFSSLLKRRWSFLWPNVK